MNALPEASEDPTVQRATAEFAEAVARMQGELSTAGIPMGWTGIAVLPPPRGPESPTLGTYLLGQLWPWGLETILRILGWLSTATAASLGAPFWFDLLRRLVSVRGAAAAPAAGRSAAGAAAGARRGGARRGGRGAAEPEEIAASGPPAG